MILYLDTSDLLKLFLDENGSDEVHEAVLRAAETTTSLIAYAEARAALASAHRRRLLDAATYRRILAEFEAQWEALVHIDVSEDIVRGADDLAERDGLPGYDAVHLASALYAQKASRSKIRFSTSKEGLRLRA